MTYLQLVNSVLRRLREEEVSTVSQNSYSKLIGEFVNDETGDFLVVLGDEADGVVGP